MSEDTVPSSPRPHNLSHESARGIEGEGPRRTLRIAFFVPSFPELSETFIARQVTGLLDRGHEVRIFAHHAASGGPVHESVERRDLGALVTLLHGGHRSVGVGRSVRVALAMLRSFRRRDAREGGWRSLARTVAMLAPERSFDIVHCHYGVMGLRYAIAARLWDAPLVVSFYGYDCSSYPRERGGAVFEPLFAEADAVTSLSGHMDARLQELGCPSGLIRRIPLSVDLAVTAPLAEPRDGDGSQVRLLTVARLTEKKGIEYALRAIALIAHDFPEVRYDVIGDGPLREELTALTASLGVGDRVRLLGPRTEGEVQAAMRGAHLFVLPSVTATNGDEEGTPTALLEAAFARLPVVATRHAGIPEIVRDGESGILVAERDALALADALRELLRSRERWQAMGDAGRQLVERSHTVPRVAGRLDAMYRELVGSHRGRPVRSTAEAPAR